MNPWDFPVKLRQHHETARQFLHHHRLPEGLAPLAQLNVESASWPAV
jgi:hypothetical protein